MRPDNDYAIEVLLKAVLDLYEEMGFDDISAQYEAYVKEQIADLIVDSFTTG